MPRRYSKNLETAGRIIDGKAFIITPDDSKLHTLNETATYLWEMSGAGFTLDEAARALAASFEVDEQQARLDAQTCLDDLVLRQVLVTD